MTSRRFLIVCMQYPVEPGHSYMTTELAEALAARGDEVGVLVLDWHGPPGAPPTQIVTPAGISVTRCAPREITGSGEMLRAASKFVLTGRHAARTARHMLDLSRFDAMIAWMPAVAIAPLLPLVERAGIRHRLLFIWDFFPDHHREIGRLPGGLGYRVVRRWEQRLLGRFSAILCTLPGNAAYLRAHYRVRADQRVLVTPIWSDITSVAASNREEVRARHDLPPGRPIAVFGGQIVAGRGFGQMLDAAEIALTAGAPLLFLFVGEGRLVPSLRARIAACENVRWLPAMPRNDYLELLAACDVGMVATVQGVTSFSLPTKTIDYLRAGLSLIAAVEPGSDFADIIRRYAIGSVVPFGEPGQFQREATRLAGSDRATTRAAAARCLDEVFDVRHALAAIDTAVAD